MKIYLAGPLFSQKLNGTGFESLKKEIESLAASQGNR